MSKVKSRKRLKTAIQVILFLVIIGGGLIFARHFLNNKPHARRSRPQKQVPLVDVQPIRLVATKAIIHAMGTIISSREISLYSELSGTVTQVSPDFIPGGKVKKGDILIKLDRKDYELKVKKQQSLVRQLQADLELEKGQQEVARKEMELMQKTLKRTIKDPKLALRVPQMEKALASLRSQQIELEQAQLDLKRTVIRAPFNAMILDRSVELGSRITAQTVLATITGTDVFWIEATVPVEKLHWIKIPGLNGSNAGEVTVRLQDGSSADGRVKRLLGDLNDKSQMARLLVEVRDPLGLKNRKGNTPLLLNSYVFLEISGNRIENVLAIPGSAVKDGNRIWIFRENRLTIRSIDPVWEDEHHLYVRNAVHAGELLITSEMSTAVDGMAVRILHQEKNSPKIAVNRNRVSTGSKDTKTTGNGERHGK